MSDRFQNKYRIESARMKNWDYGWDASYFVTICTQDRICFFGDVLDDKMVLNDIGIIARDCWMQIPEHFPFVKLGNHVVMPNHVHGIVVIDKPSQPSQPSSEYTNKFGPQSKNLASIIRGFKIGVTKNAQTINPEFAWQPRFHDHIIRNDESSQRISKYIKNNPANWKDDTLR